jgi:CheY-like chemotaxis protein
MAQATILLVEDDLVQQVQLARMLKKKGYEVLQASAGEETIRLLERHQIDLIVSDRRMPTIGGEWLLEYVRANYPKIPVVIATAYPEGVESLDPDGLLMKPFTEHELMDVVSKLVRNRST